jgi:CsoR family transcriptional regulator, copper-sensing transcriptional repressor
MNHDNHKKAHHSEEQKKNMITRLKKIEGQVRGIARMIDEDIYCDNMLHVFQSVNSALNGVKTQLLEAHVRGCVVNQILEGKDEVIDELMITMKKMLK